MNVYSYLQNYQSMLMVYPSSPAAHQAFLSAYLSFPVPPDVEFLSTRRSIVRVNPSSRVPTAIVFVSYYQNPHLYRSMSAPVELIDSHLFKDWKHHERWQKFKLVQERHRHAQPG